MHYQIWEKITPRNPTQRLMKPLSINTIKSDVITIEATVASIGRIFISETWKVKQYIHLLSFLVVKEILIVILYYILRGLVIGFTTILISFIRRALYKNLLENIQIFRIKYLNFMYLIWFELLFHKLCKRFLGWSNG